MFRPRFKSCSAPALSDKELWEAFGLLAKWFHFQPSEIYEMEWSEFEGWVMQASAQAQAAARAYQA